MRPIHPIEVLKEDYLEQLNMGANALANKLGVTSTRINEIVREKRGIYVLTELADTVLQLAKYFGGNAQFWLNLQSTYELRLAESEKPNFLDSIEPIEYV